MAEERGPRDGTAHTALPAEESARLLQQATAAASARRLTEADALLTALLDRDPRSVRGLDLLGFVRYFQGRHAEAEDACRRTLALAPDHAYAHKGLGLCLAAQGRLEDGLAELARARELKPGWFDPWWDTAVVLQGAGRHLDALAILDQACLAVPTRRADFQGFVRQIRRKLDEGGQGPR